MRLKTLIILLSMNDKKPANIGKFKKNIKVKSTKNFPLSKLFIAKVFTSKLFE